MENVMRIKWFEELDSTSSELLRHIGDYDNLSVVAAVNQTAGRGQRGNRWISAPGDNLTFSLLLRPEALPAREVMALTCYATLVVRDALRAEGVPAVIKWPNDIYVGKRKICGMLVENGLEGADIAWSVIGIGINLNQTVFPGGVQNPTSLKRGIQAARTGDRGASERPSGRLRSGFVPKRAPSPVPGPCDRIGIHGHDPGHYPRRPSTH